METIKSKDNLLPHLSVAISKNKLLLLTDLLYNEMFDVKELICLTLVPEKEVAFRASWLMENLILRDSFRYINEIDELVLNFCRIGNKSCQRHYAKIIMHLTDGRRPKMISDKVALLNLEPVAERCFDLLIDTKTPVAVKTFCLQILFNLRLRYSWIGDMLIEQLNLMMNAGKPGIKAKCRNLISCLVAG
ncbi:hypothetical protein [Mucilaginibacter paludis]|uniref:hypothetical protein n=1 Tax=Mucilaginibacter paludis TaxID=423351 RepID=UPI000318A078|nr:hypothetical protein [Mucilaginibacter paludis]